MNSQVDAAALRRKLELRHGPASGQSRPRRPVFNLIYVAPETDGDDGTASLLAELLGEHRAHAILLRLSGEARPVHARITTHRSSPPASRIETAFIELHGSLRDIAALHSTLVELRLPDLPAAVIWDSALRAEVPTVAALAADVGRVITSMIPPCAGASSLASLLALQQALGSSTLVTDAVESLLHPWQTSVATLLDSAAFDPRSIRRVRMFHSGSVVRVELALLAAWISARLSWSESNRPPASRTLHFSSEREIRFLRTPATIGSDYLEFEAPGNEPSVLRCDEPVLDNRQVTLLSRQLSTWERDPLRDAALDRASRWLRLLG